MANKNKGYIDINVGGKKRTLHFSMNFWSEFTDQLGISLQDIGNVFKDGISLKDLRALVYSAVLANDQENDNEIDYTVYTVGTWLDDLEANSINDIVNAMLESKILGNSLNAEAEQKGKPKPSKTK